jgi:hypothetical protein
MMDHTGITDMDDFDDDGDSEYNFDEDGFGQEMVFDEDDDDTTSFPKQGALLVASYDDDDVKTMQDEEQGIANTGKGSRNHREDANFPSSSSLSTFENHSAMGGIEVSDGDDDASDDDYKVAVGPLTWKQGDDDDDDDDNDNMSSDEDSGGDTITSLVSVGDDKESVTESIEQSYTSEEEKGCKLTSREIAINTIIEQSQSGAEWFEFNLPSDDDDDVQDEDDTTSDDDDLELDPADAATLNAISKSHALNRS